MSIQVELSYDMGKLLGEYRLELPDAGSVAEVVKEARERFGSAAGDFDRLAKHTAIAVNGVLVSHRRGLRTTLSAGDTVSFVKAAAGG